jgi:hypothetical protein
MKATGKHMSKKSFSFSARIDEDMGKAIVAYCEQHDISRAQWLEQVAKSFLSGNQDFTDPVDSKIDLAIAPLRDELAEMRELLGKSQAA